MADQIPLKVIRTLSDTTALGEFEIGEEVGIIHGGTGADTAADARTNLAVPPTSLTLTAGAALSGGGDLTTNRTFDVTVQNSIEIVSDNLQLVNDTLTPGNNQVYGTTGGGVKGWKADPAGGSGDPDQNLWETMSSDAGLVAANTITDTFTIAGGTGISTAIVGDTLTITNDLPDINQNLFLNVLSDSGTAVADTITDTLSILGGTGISTAVVADALTITNDSPNIVQNLWETISSDSGSSAANLATDTFTIAGGTGISTAVLGDTLTITNDSPNATHTGQVTGATALALDITAITAQPASGAVIGTDTLLINDGGTLSEVTVDQLDTYFGSGASFQLEWRFSISTTAADPGNGRFRYDNATLASVTNIYFDDQADSGFDVGTVFSTLGTGDKIYLQQNNDATKAALFTLSGAPTDNTGWWTIPVTVDSSGTLHDNNGKCSAVFLQSGAGGGGSALEVQDEGISLSTAVTKINFAGAGVTATEPVANEILVTIPVVNSIPGHFASATSVNITATTAIIAMETELLDPDAVYSFSPEGYVIIPEDGYYYVEHYTTVESDGTGGDTRGYVKSFMRKDTQGDGVFVTIEGSRQFVYTREPVDVGGSHVGFIVDFQATDELQLKINQKTGVAVDISTDAVRCGISIFKLRDL